MKNWPTELVFRDIFFQTPKLRRNEWLSYMYRQFREAEDEGERAPSIFPVSPQMSEQIIPKSDEFSPLMLMNMLTKERPTFIIGSYPRNPDARVFRGPRPVNLKLSLKRKRRRWSPEETVIPGWYLDILDRPVSSAIAGLIPEVTPALEFKGELPSDHITSISPGNKPDEPFVWWKNLILPKELRQLKKEILKMEKEEKRERKERKRSEVKK